MSGADAPVLALIFGSFGILAIAVAFVVALVWHQRRWMRASEERSRFQEALLEATSIGRLVPWSCNLDGSGLDIGEAVHKILGAGRWRHLDELLDRAAQTGAGRMREAIGALETGEDVVLACAMQSEDGRGLDTRWHVGRRGDQLKGLIRDVSQEQGLQRQLLQAQKLEALGTLVGGVAHEFGNLLAAVEGCARAVQRRDGLDARSQKGLGLILDATQRGRGIIRQLLDHARRDPGAMQPVDLNRLLEEVAALLEPLLGKRFTIVKDTEAALPRVVGDPIGLHQALLNLCINARDAMPEGGTLTLGTRICSLASDVAELRGKAAGRYVCLEVKDEGRGIPPEHLERIFEPFFTTKGPGQGTGLGLSVTHSIAEAHLGLLQCESEPGRGSCFILLLPALE